MKTNAKYARGLGRASVGALLFALPLYMTMEMWEVGATGDPIRMAVLLIAAFPLLVGLSYFAGFERAFGLVDHVLDAFAAFAVAVCISALALTLFGVFTLDEPIASLTGKIAIVSFPAAIGALLASKQLGQRASDNDGDRTYGARLFLMLVGAVFIALNVAPTEEMVLIAHRISPLQATLLALVSLALLHTLLFWVDFAGGERARGRQEFWSVLLRYSSAGYAICVAASVFLLWVFGRTEGAALDGIAQYAVVLSFAASLGAGLAHVVVSERRG